MLVVQVDTVAIYGSRASEATKKPKGSYCQAWPTPRQVEERTEDAHKGHGKFMHVYAGWCMS